MLLALIAALAISTTTSNSEIRNISVWHQPAQLTCYQHFRFNNKAEFYHHHDAIKDCILNADAESTIRITTTGGTGPIQEENPGAIGEDDRAQAVR